MKSLLNECFFELYNQHNTQEVYEYNEVYTNIKKKDMKKLLLLRTKMCILFLTTKYTNNVMA